MHLHLYTNQDMVLADTVLVPGGTAVVASRRCPHATSANEDAAMVWCNGDQEVVLAVADGMGGGRAGEQAAQFALDHLAHAIMNTTEVPLRSRIIDGFEAANRAVLAMGIGAATTLAVVAVEHQSVRTYHVGDSTILLCGQRGRLKWQTTSHSPVGFAVEAGVLDEDDAMQHEDRHVVSNVVGSPGMRIEIGPTLKLARYDTVLLGSDGVFDNLRLDEVVQCIRKGPLDRAAWTLSERAYERMMSPEQGQPSKPDDFTIIAFRVSTVADDKKTPAANATTSPQG